MASLSCSDLRSFSSPKCFTISSKGLQALDLADQGAGGAGVRGAAPHHREARQHACGCPGAAAREDREAMKFRPPDPG
jgi:hypothetical protein